MFAPGIFNDVLSPITPGPSSSNTCGPHRIGTLARQLLGEEPRRLTVRMAAAGGYSDTFYSMHSDVAFLAAVLGKELLSYDLTRAYEDARQAGLAFEARFVEDMPLQPSELAELTLAGEREEITLTAASLGGGEILISRLNGQAVELDGKYYAAVTFLPDGAVRVRRSARPFEPDGPENSAGRVAYLEPVYPFVPTGEAPPFRDAATLRDYVGREGKTLWQAALDYESAVTGAEPEALRCYARELLDLCRQAAEKGRAGAAPFAGVTAPRAPAYGELLAGRRLIPLGAADRGCLDAMAIMEHSNAHGTIVCMPTGGASGIVPAAIECAADALGKGETDRVNALLTAGLIGTFYYPTHYTGAIGCQAEIGVAVSMAAAALAGLLTDDADAALCAASLGGQSLLGLTCSPVEGYVQVPCILRNMAAVPLAITCANGALAGMDHVVPLDDVVRLMLAVGAQIRPCNRAGNYCRPAGKEGCCHD